MEGSIKSPAKVKVNTHVSPFIHQPGHLTVQGYQVGKALFSFYKHADYSRSFSYALLCVLLVTQHL